MKLNSGTIKEAPVKKRISVGDFQISVEERAAINEVLDAGRISEWKKVREFERLFADYVNTKHCVAVNSGTSALIIGLSALINESRFPKVRKGSKVITTPLTYIATINAIVLTGLEPVFVDINPYDFSILPQKIEEHLESANDPKKYSIILPVHLMGYPCDMDEINRIAEKYDLVVLEDSAQAHGSLYKGEKTGSLSFLSVFSFYIAHNIQAGEMGAVATDDANLISLMRKLKANGRMCDCSVCTRPNGYCPYFPGYEDDDLDPRFVHDVIGYNFKIMEFEAALGVSQLKKADFILEKRQNNVRFLNEHLDKYSDDLQLPAFSKDISYLAYPIVIKEHSKFTRKYLREELEKNGVESRPLFGCVPTQQPAYNYLKEEYEGKIPNAEYAGKKAFYIGCHQYLEREDLDYAVKAFDQILAK
ncbi:MAG: perosamine synthetase [Candidatus Scalindua rubra]|uniref:Perosamine synthetase n=1 Tax=Candidatus Scalindua rubra TaxID=1872076 RepID=A0A1E3XGG2_9BACT|nr:MAG: perosamine synthetase [Candidatus Scalindua rubra]